MSASHPPPFFFLFQQQHIAAEDDCLQNKQADQAEASQMNKMSRLALGECGRQLTTGARDRSVVKTQEFARRCRFQFTCGRLTSGVRVPVMLRRVGGGGFLLLNPFNCVLGRLRVVATVRVPLPLRRLHAAVTKRQHNQHGLAHLSDASFLADLVRFSANARRCASCLAPTVSGDTELKRALHWMAFVK